MIDMENNFSPFDIIAKKIKFLFIKKQPALHSTQQTQNMNIMPSTPLCLILSSLIKNKVKLF
jgi:hypothetical protein